MSLWPCREGDQIRCHLHSVFVPCFKGRDRSSISRFYPEAIVVLQLKIKIFVFFDLLKKSHLFYLISTFAKTIQSSTTFPLYLSQNLVCKGTYTSMATIK